MRAGNGYTAGTAEARTRRRLRRDRRRTRRRRRRNEIIWTIAVDPGDGKVIDPRPGHAPAEHPDGTELVDIATRQLDAGNDAERTTKARSWSTAKRTWRSKRKRRATVNAGEIIEYELNVKTTAPRTPTGDRSHDPTPGRAEFVTAELPGRSGTERRRSRSANSATTASGRPATTPSTSTSKCSPRTGITNNATSRRRRPRPEPGQRKPDKDDDGRNAERRVTSRS